MKKEITPGLYVSTKYLNKYKMSILPIDGNSGLYILSLKNQEIIYFHDIDIVLSWDLDSFKKKYGINRISELVSFFKNAYLPSLLIENDFEVFSGTGIFLFDEIADYDNFQNLLN